VKVGQLPAWLARRSMNPVDWGRACSRAYWRWSHKYYLPKYANLAPAIQVIVSVCTISYIINIERIRHHKAQKYHW